MMRCLLWTTLLTTLLWVSPAIAQAPPTAPLEKGEAEAAAPEFAADVTIFSSRANQVALEEAGVDYRRGVKYWANLCETAGLSFRIAGDYELSTGPAKSKLYVLHYIERLTLEQRHHLEALMGTGAALVVIGMAGSADIDGATHPPSLAEEWFDLRDVRPYTPKESAYFVMLPPTPLSLTADPGRRFEFDWTGRFYLANTIDAAAANVDWTLQPLPASPSFAQNAVIALRTKKGSRMAWFGVGPDAVFDETDGRTMYDASMLHLLNWLVRKPAAASCYWQGCAQAAAIVTADVEDKFETGEAIALACHKEKVRGSFFLVGKLAPDYPEVVAALNENGDIGTHSMNHGSFKERGFKDQVDELEQGKVALEILGVTNVMGFRPPMEEYDYDTLQAVAHADLKFIYGNLDYDRAFPITREVDGKVIYQFPRIVADDYNLVVERGVSNATEYQREYFKEFKIMQRLGGVFPFSFHTNYLALQESVDVIRAMVVRVRQEDAWITTFAEIVDWLEVRRQMAVSVTSEGSVIILTVSNKSAAAVMNFPVRVFPHRDQVQLVAVATPSKGLSVGATGPAGTVVMVDLKPGETKVIKLR
jgi:hypothetical protein